MEKNDSYSPLSPPIPSPASTSAASFKSRRRDKPSKRRRARQTFVQQSSAVPPTLSSAPVQELARLSPEKQDQIPSNLSNSTSNNKKLAWSSRWDTLPVVNNHGQQHDRTTTTLQTDDTDRQWYLGNDNDDNSNNLTADEGLIARRRSKKLTERAVANMADTTRWETNQLSSGLHSQSRNKSSTTHSNINNLDDSGPRVTLLVNELSPIFLTDSNNKTNNNVVVGNHAVWPVKDVTSDMAVIARNGSATVTTFRENRERGKARVKYWDLGNHLGGKAMENANADAERDAKHASIAKESGNDWKEDMKYSKVMSDMNVNNKNEVLGDVKNDKERSMSIAEVRRSLPVYGVKRKLLNLIREHQVCIVVGETGSGKTTQLAQYLEEEGYGRYGNGIIGCTQPRRVAAVSVAQRVAEEYHGIGCKVGEQVGYTIRFEDCSNDKKTVIKFMTDGILMRESLNDPDLDKYSIVIMDEAHERSLNTDVLFGILRNIITHKRLDLKIIITSATMNSMKFSKFFGNAPIFNIPGRIHPVDIFYSRNPIEDYVKGAVYQALQLHIQASIPGDILIFMTGQEDIEATCETLAEEINKRTNPKPVLILPIYSQLPSDLQAKIFQPADEGVRKVIVATNIAETSLTINGIKYVIDCGYCKLKSYNPRLGIDSLLVCPTSQSSINQRSGRAGRTGPGKCYRLFTKASYETELLEMSIPEIQRTNLSHVILLLKNLGIKKILDFHFIDKPSNEIILRSMYSLWLIGALNIIGELTELGKKMSIFPLDPGLSNLIFIGNDLNCLLETITIVAMLSVPNIFVRPSGKEEESDQAREKFYIPESDHLTLLHVYQRWLSSGYRPEWCSRNYVNYKSLRKAREIREQLLDIAKSQNMALSSPPGGDDWDSIRKAIGIAFFYQAARRKGIGEYINIRSNIVCSLHPTCAMYGSGLSPDYVVYHELIMTKKEYMNCVTAVDPQWLAEAGPMLYTLKQAGGGNHDTLFRAKRTEIEDEILRHTSRNSNSIK